MKGEQSQETERETIKRNPRKRLQKKKKRKGTHYRDKRKET
jgi:hypothetical protein